MFLHRWFGLLCTRSEVNMYDHELPFFRPSLTWSANLSFPGHYCRGGEWPGNEANHVLCLCNKSPTLFCLLASCCRRSTPILAPFGMLSPTSPVTVKMDPPKLVPPPKRTFRKIWTPRNLFHCQIWTPSEKFGPLQVMCRNYFFNE